MVFCNGKKLGSQIYSLKTKHLLFKSHFDIADMDGWPRLLSIEMIMKISRNKWTEPPTNKYAASCKSDSKGDYDSLDTDDGHILTENEKRKTTNTLI